MFSEDPIDTIILSVPEEDEVSIETVARLIARQFDYEERIVFDSAYSDGQYKKTASNELLRKLLPDFVFTGIENGIQQTVKWFVENQEIVRK